MRTCFLIEISQYGKLCYSGKVTGAWFEPTGSASLDDLHTTVPRQAGKLHPRHVHVHIHVLEPRLSPSPFSSRSWDTPSSRPRTVVDGLDGLGHSLVNPSTI